MLTIQRKKPLLICLQLDKYSSSISSIQQSIEREPSLMYPPFLQIFLFNAFLFKGSSFSFFSPHLLSFFSLLFFCFFYFGYFSFQISKTFVFHSILSLPIICISFHYLKKFFFVSFFTLIFLSKFTKYKFFVSNHRTCHQIFLFSFLKKGIFCFLLHLLNILKPQKTHIP